MTDSLTLMPPPTTVDCPSGQNEVLARVSHTNVAVSEPHAGTESIPGTFSRTFLDVQHRELLLPHVSPRAGCRRQRDLKPDLARADRWGGQDFGPAPASNGGARRPRNRKRSHTMRFHRVIAAFGGAAALLLTAAPAGARAVHITDHYTVGFSEPSVTPCEPPLAGVLTVEGEGVFTLTDTGRTFELSDNLHGSFSFDPDDPAVPTSSGHFVVQHRENVNYAQLQDWRVTDTQHTIVHVADGTNFPIQIRTTVLFSADGGVEVKVDSVRCGGQAVA
jgi:hypothetical protein